jgi:hypothetical protein
MTYFESDSQEVAEHLKPMPLCQQRQIGGGFRNDILFPECNYGTHFTTFLTLSLDRLRALQHLSI